MKKRALLYMTKNENVSHFASKLLEQGFEVLAYGKTLEVLRENDIQVLDFSEISQAVKPDKSPDLLQDEIVYGITAKRSDLEQVSFIREREIEPIDIVCVNFEEFSDLKKIAQAKETSFLSLIDFEKINIISMAIKNYEDVAILVSHSDYDKVLEEISEKGEVSLETRTNLASTAVSYIANYVSLLDGYFMKLSTGNVFPQYFNLTFTKEKELTSGENTYQTAALYKDRGFNSDAFEVFGTNSEGYSSVIDLSFAYSIIKDIKEPSAIAVKREIICGAGTGFDTYDACTKAFRSEGVNMNGAVLLLNSLVDRKTAHEIIKFAFETVVAPEITEEAMEVFKEKQGLKLIINKGEFLNSYADIFSVKQISGGMVVQSADTKLSNANEFLYVTAKRPEENQEADLMFGFSCVKGSKSVSVALVKDGQVVGIGQGQLDILKALKTALDTAGEQVKGSVFATDTAITSPELIENLALLGVTAIIQSGGTVNTQDIIDACNNLGISMMVTNTTYYKN